MLNQSTDFAVVSHVSLGIQELHTFLNSRIAPLWLQRQICCNWKKWGIMLRPAARRPASSLLATAGRAETWLFLHCQKPTSWTSLYAQHRKNHFVPATLQEDKGEKELGTALSSVCQVQN